MILQAYFLVFAPIFLALVYGAYLFWWLKKQPSGDEKMKEISRAIFEGSRAYLNRQYRAVAIVAAAIFVILYFFLGWIAALGFLIGGFVSALTGYIGINIAARSNEKTVQAASEGLPSALLLVFRAGSITGLLVAGLGLLVVAGFFLIFENPTGLIGLALGASLISVFARLGGGIFAKAADVGADLVGKIETGIPEDDLRNPGVIADNIGDNVGDCAGMAADLFETYAVTLVAAILLGISTVKTSNAAIFPLVLSGLALLSSLIGFFFVRLSKNGSVMGAMYKGLFASLILAAGGAYIASRFIFGAGWSGIFFSALIGLSATALIVVMTNYYTSKKFRPVRSIARASHSGYGANIIMGVSVGMEASIFPVVVIALAILGSFTLGGIYGIGVASVAMLSVAGIIAAIDSFGPITDNAGGIARMAGKSEGTRKITGLLDAAGNTTKAVTKGYAIASAGLAALVLFSEFTGQLKEMSFNINNHLVLVGILIGAAIPNLFSALTLRSVGQTATRVAKEIRRQFREIPGLLENKASPEYERVVNIATKEAIREMVFPILLPIAAVLLVGFLLRAQALGGLLIGVIISGLFVALSMTSGGAAWDNTKKFIEEGNHGDEGSEIHKAAVIGDMVGDPYKDTAGPAINPLIKVVNVLALLIVPFLR